VNGDTPNQASISTTLVYGVKTTSGKGEVDCVELAVEFFA